MNAIVEIISGTLYLICPECGNVLEETDSDVTVVIHPDREGGWSGTKHLIRCQYAGKQFNRPTISLTAK